jgi:imidazolonepropionase
MGFDITVHADQFSPIASKLAVDMKAKSADHLENSTEVEIAYLAHSDTVAVALPGASLGVGDKFTPARKLLDAGAILAIATDYNPGSAPMGNLLLQASILAMYEKLSTAEVFAGITYRAAHALGLQDRGIIEVGKRADFVAFRTDDYRNILYQATTNKVYATWSKGKMFKKM